MSSFIRMQLHMVWTYGISTTKAKGRFSVSSEESKGFRQRTVFVAFLYFEEELLY